MLSTSDIIYYTDPVPTFLGEGKRMLVTDTAYDRNSRMIGTIMDVKEEMANLSGRPWRVTTDGTYVRGHLLRTTRNYGSAVVGFAPGQDDRFYLGSIFDTTNTDEPMLIISTARNSLAQYITPLMSDSYASRMVLSSWFPAAPWAGSLLPAPGDTSETVTAKLELAKARWKFNVAVMEMEYEGYNRNWTTQLEELHSNTDLSFLPEVRVGLVFTGDVMVPVTAERPRPTLGGLEQELADKVRAFTAKSTMAPILGAQRMAVRMSFPLDLKLDPKNIPADHNSNVTRAVQQHLGDSSVTVGTHSSTYFVNGLTSLV